MLAAVPEVRKLEPEKWQRLLRGLWLSMSLLLSQAEAAQRLDVSAMSVHRLVQSAILPADQPSPGLPCIIRESDLAAPKVQQAVHRIRSNLPQPLPADPNQRKLF